MSKSASPPLSKSSSPSSDSPSLRSASSLTKPLRVGFDLDGVLLYNPARLARPLISVLKKKHIAIDRKELEFYVPKPGWEQFFWELLHKSSIFIAPGFGRIKKLKDQGLIEPYLVTARFNHLKKDFDNWKKKMEADQLFECCYLNEADEQPHLFKQRLIKELGLNVFIEDNWDIVNYLHRQCQQTDIFWISNLVDRRLDYPNKFMSLKAALDHLPQLG
ncbi:MAG: hypothetical protein GF381_02430 [Candidatus Pacebacteria bacterium]|nr:hypothetical protein [Candidatus Paceibacterota bacterium]